MKLSTYRASDRRVYNGCPCSDMKREWDHTDKLGKLLKSLDPTASVTYFPAEGKYMVFTNSNILENPDLVGPPREITGKFHASKQEAIIEAVETIRR